MNINQITEEIEEVSQKYAKKFNIDRNDDWFILKLQEELGELIQAHLMLTGRARQKDKTKVEIKRDFEKEVADVLGQILLVARHHNIDLEKVIEEKWLVWNKK